MRFKEKEASGNPREQDLDLVMESLRGNIGCEGEKMTLTQKCHCILVA